MAFSDSNMTTTTNKNDNDRRCPVNMSGIKVYFVVSDALLYFEFHAKVVEQALKCVARPVQQGNLISTQI